MADDPRVPAGCLIVQGALAGADEAESARWEAVARRATSEGALRRRLQGAKREGDLPEGADSTDLARYVKTIMHGMAVQAAGGASSDQLRRVAQVAPSEWPKR
jgi:hypothetical protein